MDAVPVTLGQEFGGYAAQVREGIERVRDSRKRLGKIPLGGTAVGTGLNTHPEFAAKVRELLSADTGLQISAPADAFEAQAARDGLVEASGALKVVAVSLTKIANDLRLMGSGPRAGLAEIFLPELQKGSSIMPGKVNPVIPEVVTQVAAQVIGNDQAITVGGLQGHFELNVFVPMMARNLLDSIKLLASASRLLAEKCVDGIEANREQCERYAELTLSAATALNPYIGYDKAAEIVKAAAASGRSLREVAREAGVDDATLDEALDYRKMAKPHTRATTLARLLAAVLLALAGCAGIGEDDRRHRSRKQNLSRIVLQPERPHRLLAPVRRRSVRRPRTRPSVPPWRPDPIRSRSPAGRRGTGGVEPPQREDRSSIESRADLFAETDGAEDDFRALEDDLEAGRLLELGRTSRRSDAGRRGGRCDPPPGRRGCSAALFRRRVAPRRRDGVGARQRFRPRHDAHRRARARAQAAAPNRSRERGVDASCGLSQFITTKHKRTTYSPRGYGPGRAHNLRGKTLKRSLVVLAALMAMGTLVCVCWGRGREAHGHL